MPVTKKRKRTDHKCQWQRKKDQTTNVDGKRKMAALIRQANSWHQMKQTKQLKPPQKRKWWPTCKHKVEKTPPNHNTNHKSADFTDIQLHSNSYAVRIFRTTEARNIMSRQLTQISEKQHDLCNKAVIVRTWYKISLVHRPLEGLVKAVFVCNGTLKIDPVMKVYA